MRCYLTNDKIGFIKKKKELMKGSKPNFELIFSEDENGQSISTPVITLKKAVGENNLIKLIIVMLEDLVNYFNVQRPMTMDQITELAIEILEEMRDLRFEEIIAFIEGVKRQEYGKIYERFDASMFWEFYWGKNEDDQNSFNYKKTDWLILDNSKGFSKEPIVKTELQELLTKPRTSGNAVQDFIQDVKTRFPKPNEKK